VDFGLSKEFMMPLRSYERFDPDPLAGIIAAMGDLADNEVAAFQVLFGPVRHAWPESIVRAVTDAKGESFFADDPSMVKLAAQKISVPLFAAIIRVAAQSPRVKLAWRIVQGIGKSLQKFADPASNELMPLTNDEYDMGSMRETWSRGQVAARGCSSIVTNCCLSRICRRPRLGPQNSSAKNAGRRRRQRWHSAMRSRSARITTPAKAFR
jgi:hypothetical protein